MAASFLKFPVTTDILATYNTGVNTELFDTSDNTYKFWVLPDGRSPITNDLGEKGISRGININLIKYSSEEKGFEVTTLDQRYANMQVLNTLRNTAKSNKTTITVLDYLEPDSGDFTEREMVMLNPVRPNGAPWVDVDGNRWYRGGFTIELIEI